MGLRGRRAVPLIDIRRRVLRVTSALRAHILPTIVGKRGQTHLITMSQIRVNMRKSGPPT